MSEPAATPACYYFGMNLQEELERVVREGRAAIDEQRDLDRKFEQEWDNANRGVIWNAMAEAQTPLQPLGQAQRERRDGCPALRIFLPGNNNESSPDFTLKFAPDKAARVVKMTTHPDDLMPPDSISLDALDAGAVRERIVAFTRAIFAKMLEPPKGGRSAAVGHRLR
jgi:hypothetical protein